LRAKIYTMNDAKTAGGKQYKINTNTGRILKVRIIRERII
jgi:hypothetical protein